MLSSLIRSIVRLKYLFNWKEYLVSVDILYASGTVVAVAVVAKFSFGLQTNWYQKLHSFHFLFLKSSSYLWSAMMMMCFEIEFEFMDSCFLLPHKNFWFAIKSFLFSIHLNYDFREFFSSQLFCAERCKWDYRRKFHQFTETNRTTQWLIWAECFPFEK